tara:strand:+ start:3204 stop:3401 length:198 start_codon:yes stop_codon:yes gene_type:complete
MQRHHHEPKFAIIRAKLPLWAIKYNTIKFFLYCSANEVQTSYADNSILPSMAFNLDYFGHISHKV